MAIALREPPDEWLLGSSSASAPTNWQRLRLASLFCGWAGIALLHGYRYEHTGDAADRDAATSLLGRSLDVIAALAAPPDLSEGFAGIAWATHHLQRLLDGVAEDDLVAPADEALEILLGSSRVLRNYDLISGLAGMGVYAIERGSVARARVCLRHVVDRLESLADRGDGWTRWFTLPEALPQLQRELAPAGLYNLGMAHGAAGVLAMLGAAYASGFADARIPVLVRTGAHWLLDQERPTDPVMRFANWIAPGAEDRASRFAWCYGDPGVIIGLVGAARGIGDRDLLEESLDLARAASAVGCDHPGIRDAGCCHGAAGLGHIFNRIYQATGEDCFANAARRWFDRTLAMRQPEMGVGGFCTYRHPTAGGDPWITDASLLSGATGTALALLAAISAQEPLWDRVLLTSIPERRGD